MSTSSEIEKIFQNFHRSAYRHFERSTECQNERVLPNILCTEFPCARTIGLPEKSRKLRKKFHMFRTVHKTLSEVARKLTAFGDNTRNCKRRKICGKNDLQKATERDDSMAKRLNQKIPSPISVNDGSPSSSSFPDGNDYFGDTSRIHSIVLVQETHMERTDVDLADGEIV